MKLTKTDKEHLQRLISKMTPKETTMSIGDIYLEAEKQNPQEYVRMPSVATCPGCQKKFNSTPDYTDRILTHCPACEDNKEAMIQDDLADLSMKGGEWGA